MTQKIKICYILPEYNIDTDSHFYHHYERLEKLSDKLDIFLIAEKGKNVGNEVSHIKQIYVQRFKFLPLRFLESFFVLMPSDMSTKQRWHTLNMS